MEKRGVVDENTPQQPEGCCKANNCCPKAAEKQAAEVVADDAAGRLADEAAKAMRGRGS
jgi:hypothetical protein